MDFSLMPAYIEGIVTVNGATITNGDIGSYMIPPDSNYYLRSSTKFFSDGSFRFAVVPGIDTHVYGTVNTNVGSFGLNKKETEKDIELTLDLVEELKHFKSLIVTLFLVSMGRLKDRTESFTVEKMTPTQSELFMKCWEHNIDWGQYLLQEYFLTNSGISGYGLKFLFSYASKQSKKLIQQCKKDYDCDLSAMIRDERGGKIRLGPAPIRFIYRFLRENR